MYGSAKTIVTQAQIALQDVEGIRWPSAELLGYLLDGERLVVQALPGESAKTVTHVCVEGARQTLPDEAVTLIEVIRNTSTPSRSISKVSQDALEASVRGWQGMRVAQRIAHYMHSSNEPRVFLLYPPPAAGVGVELTYCKYPAEYPEPTGTDASGISSDTSLQAKWDSVLLDYVLYRAWLKDSEIAANAAKAASYLSTFTAALGLQTQATT